MASGGGRPVFLWLDRSASPAPVAQATVAATGEPLTAWVEGQPAPAAVLSSPVPNRYVAFGDSITWGEYDENAGASYPDRLDFRLDSQVRPSEVLNFGEPGERTNGGSLRIGGVVSDKSAQVCPDHGRHQRRQRRHGIRAWSMTISTR